MKTFVALLLVGALLAPQVHGQICFTNGDLFTLVQCTGAIGACGAVEGATELIPSDTSGSCGASITGGIVVAANAVACTVFAVERGSTCAATTTAAPTTTVASDSSDSSSGSNSSRRRRRR